MKATSDKGSPLPERPHAIDSVGFLKDILAQMSRSNPRYSMRAFAAKLGLSPGGLSQILSRKKRLSPQRAHEIAKKLQLGAADADYLLALVQIEGAKTDGLKSNLIEKLESQHPSRAAVHNLSLDQFRLISDWFGFAVFEYISVNGQVRSAQQVAAYFGISRAEADITIERLENLNLIERTKAGFLGRVRDRVLISSHNPNEALRNYYHSIVSKIEESIDQQLPQEKFIGTEVLAFDPSQLKEVARLADDFLISLEKLAAKGKKRTEVYQAFFNFFKLNKNDKGSPK